MCRIRVLTTRTRIDVSITGDDGLKSDLVFARSSLQSFNTRWNRHRYGNKIFHLHAHPRSSICDARQHDDEKEVPFFASQPMPLTCLSPTGPSILCHIVWLQVPHAIELSNCDA